MSIFKGKAGTASETGKQYKQWLTTILILLLLSSVRVPGCQKIQMTVSLTRSGTGCFIAVPIWQQWANNRVNMMEFASHGFTTHSSKKRATIWTWYGYSRHQQLIEIEFIDNQDHHRRWHSHSSNV